MVFPDTSPRGVDETCPDAGSDWPRGYGAGHYCNATQAPWNKHFNMYDYVTKELPSIVERYFHICPERKSVTGFSMGGNGALILAAKNPGAYRSVTAMSPISQPTKADTWCKTAFESFFGSMEAGADYSAIDLLNAKGSDLTMPPGFVDVASNDQFRESLDWAGLLKALRTNGHANFGFNWHEGYDHSFFFVASRIEEHIDFHAAHLYR